MLASGNVFSGPRAEAPMDVLELAQVRSVIVPLDRLAHALSGIVAAIQNVLDAMLCREVVQGGDEGVILRRVEVRYLRLEERELQILHLQPIDDLRMQVETERIHQLFDVVHGLLRIPACIDVEHERAQAEFLLGEVREIRAVYTAADAEDAIVIAAAACALDLLHETHDLALAALVRVPVRQNVRMEVVAVVAPATRVERNARVARIHDAVTADLVLPHHT